LIRRALQITARRAARQRKTHDLKQGYLAQYRTAFGFDRRISRPIRCDVAVGNREAVGRARD
jgi:hypothetical protein